MSDDIETIHIKGEGGMIIAHDLPLPEHIADRMTKGYLTRCNEDGSPWEAPEGAETDPAGGVVVPAQPSDKAVKAEWVGWAVSQGATPDEAEAMTKADLIDKYGK